MKTFRRSKLTNIRNLRSDKRNRGFISFAITLVLILGISFNANAQENRKDTITILTFNDFHGAFLPDGDTPGAARFVSEFLALKARVPNPVVVSGGDNFSGSFFSLKSEGEPHELFTRIATTDQPKIISAVGNHEFDWESDYLLKNNTEYIDYVGMNVSSKNDPTGFRNLIPACRKIELNGGREVAIIGISTPTTPISGKKPYVDDYNFEPVNGQAISWIAKQQNADLNIILMHIGTSMEGDVPVIHSDDKESEEKLRQLPHKFIHGIVSAHSHELVCGDFTIADGRKVPMIQAGSNGTHIGMIQYELDGANVRCIKNELVKVSTDAVPDPYIERLVNNIIDGSGFNKEIALISKDMSHSREPKRDLHTFTEVGAIVTASYLNEISRYREVGDKPVIAVHHFKGIRTGLPKGSLKKAIAGNVLPFGGNLGVYRVTGAQIRDLFTQGLARNSRGRLQTCNMMFITNSGRITTMYLWHKDTSCYIEITDDMECILICDDYIAYGGDNYDLELLGKEVDWFGKTVTTDCFLNFIESKGIFPNDEYRIAESSELNRRYNKKNRTDRPRRRQTVDMRYGAGAAL